MLIVRNLRQNPIYVDGKLVLEPATVDKTTRVAKPAQAKYNARKDAEIAIPHLAALESVGHIELVGV